MKQDWMQLWWKSFRQWFLVAELGVRVKKWSGETQAFHDSVDLDHVSTSSPVRKRMEIQSLNSVFTGEMANLRDQFCCSPLNSLNLVHITNKKWMPGPDHLTILQKRSNEWCEKYGEGYIIHASESSFYQTQYTIRLIHLHWYVFLESGYNFRIIML